MNEREREEEFFRNPGPGMEVPADIRRRVRRRKVFKITAIAIGVLTIIGLLILAGLHDRALR